ncbi:MAG: hypothetical protein PHG05_00330 [Candidatus Nanoarchaeia archaeon]|nr:hypothetical protein [Candidatus Nanoarchaeia archaeon]
MVKKTIILLTLVFAFLLQAYTQEVSLAKFRWGMSLEEVQKIEGGLNYYPETKSWAKTTKFWNDDGCSGLNTILILTFYNNQLSVIIYRFDTFYYCDQEFTTFFQYLGLFYIIEDTLTRKYGKGTDLSYAKEYMLSSESALGNAIGNGEAFLLTSRTTQNGTLILHALKGKDSKYIHIVSLSVKGFDLDKYRSGLNPYE